MFSWFRKKSIGFEPQPQELYRYWDGSQKVIGDPLAILRRLATDDGFDIDRETKLSQVEGAVGMKAYGELVDGIRRAFEIPAVRDGGLTDVNCCSLLLNFWQYLDTVKKNSPPLPISASPSPDTQADPSPEAKDSDSTSTDTVAPPDAPCPSLPVSVP